MQNNKSLQIQCYHQHYYSQSPVTVIRLCILCMMMITTQGFVLTKQVVTTRCTPHTHGKKKMRRHGHTTSSSSSSVTRNHHYSHYTRKGITIFNSMTNKKMSSSRRWNTFHLLFSSLYFDDDDDVNLDDINWDDEEEDDHDEQDHKEHNLNNPMMEDDTDESYYEQLFEQQAGIVLKQGEEEDDDDEGFSDKGFDENAIQIIKQQDCGGDQELREQRRKESIQKAEEYYQSMKQLKHDFHRKRNQLQNQSKARRKEDREMLHRMRLEERAMFLALRALRRQYSFNYDPKIIVAPTLNWNEDSTNATNIQQQPNFDKMDQVMTSFNSIPLPTLSLSASRSYKCKEDYVTDDIIQIEKRLYGHRFKNTYSIYVRLLETLDAIKLDSKRKAQDYLHDKIEQSVRSTTLMSPVQSDLEKTIEMNTHQKERMNVIITLSLFTANKYPLDKGRSKKTLEKEKIMDAIDKQYNLDSIEVQDLASILRIRGNVKRRGRLPKKRNQIIEQLAVSFSNDLFQ